MAPALEELRNRTFLAWDDDSGDGYAAALAYVVPAPGDYVLVAAGSLSALGRATSGDYELLIGLNAPAAQDGAAEPAGPRPSRNGFRAPGASRRPSKKHQAP